MLNFRLSNKNTRQLSHHQSVGYSTFSIASKRTPTHQINNLKKKTTTQKQSTLFNNIIPSSESSPPKEISPNPPKQPNMSLKMGCIIWPLNRENDPRDFKGGYRSPSSPRPHCSLHHTPPSPTSKPGPPRSAPPAPCRCP